MKKKRITYKYRVTCKGPSELTEYNEEWNKKVVDSCLRSKENLFEPHPGKCQGCNYLELKKLS